MWRLADPTHSRAGECAAACVTGQVPERYNPTDRGLAVHRLPHRRGDARAFEVVVCKRLFCMSTSVESSGPLLWIGSFWP